MKEREFVQVDPATLHLPGSRRDGADLMKLHEQIAKYGATMDGMPALDVKRGSDGKLMAYDGITRATRIAKLRPGEFVTAEVTGNLRGPVGSSPTIGDTL